MVTTDNTIATSMGNFTHDDFIAMSKAATEFAERQKELLKLQKKIADDKIAALKGESEAEKNAKKARQALEELKEEELKQQQDKVEESIENNKKLFTLEELKAKEEEIRRKKLEANQKETDEYNAKKQKEDEERRKTEQTAAEKLKNSRILDVLPDRIQNTKPEPKNDDVKSEKKTFFSDMKGYTKELIDVFKPPKTKEDGEQKDLGEKIQRVSFHPEGIKILRTLLEPIYKALNAFTGDMDKGLKGIINKMGDMFSNKSGIGKLLLLLLADLLFMTGKLGAFFSYLKEAPGRIWKFFEEIAERLIKQLGEYGKAFKRFLYDEPVKLLKRMGLDVEEIFARIGNKIAEFGTRVFNSLRGLGEGLMERLGINRLFSGLSRMKTSFMKEFEPMIDAFRDTGKIFKDTWQWIIRVKNGFADWIGSFRNIFRGDGVFSSILKNVESFMGNFGKIKGPIQSIYESIAAVLKPLEVLFPLVKGIFRLISLPVIQTIEGIYYGFKTLFSVFGDDKLSFLQKATAVFMGFIGGLGNLVSGIFKLGGSIFDGIGSILKKIPLIGGVIGGAVSGFGDAFKWLGDKTDTSKLGQQTIDLLHTMNEGSKPVGNDAYKSGEKYKNASPEEKKKIDEQHAALEHKGEHFVSQGKDPKKGTWVKDDPSKPQPVQQGKPPETKPEVKPAAPAVVMQPAPVAQQYQPTPHDIELRGQIDNNFNSVLKTNQRIIDKLHDYIDFMKKSNSDIINKNTTVINQNQQVAPHDDSKDYLTKMHSDRHEEVKNKWYANSMNYRSSLPS
jgi:hypothetical protein